MRRVIVDPFSGVRKKVLEKKKLHYVDADEDLRAAYVDSLNLFPCRGYVVYKELRSNADYPATYLALIEKLFPHRFKGCAGAFVELVFEENPRLSLASIDAKVNEVFSRLKSAKDLRPIAVNTRVGKKNEFLSFSMPDFLLAIFAKYAKHDIRPDDRNARFFEKLRDKYRVILDADTGIVYSRKRPFLPWQ